MFSKIIFLSLILRLNNKFLERPLVLNLHRRIPVFLWTGWRQILEKEPVKPWLWLRYTDDIFFIWTGSEEKLTEFMAGLDMFHPNLKFTWEPSRSFVNFLDAVAGIKGENFVTDVYYKPIDCHQFWHYESSHPSHIIRSIVYSKGLRIKRIRSTYLFLGHLE